MTHERLPGELLLSEAQFREVIERATQRDLSDTGVSIETLRQVADDLAIDRNALEEALREVVACPPPAASAPVLASSGGGVARPLSRIGQLLDDILPRRGRLMVGALVGGSLGWLSAHVGNTVATGANAFIDVPLAAALILFTLANSLGRRVEGRYGRFVAETTAMWSGFGIAWSITAGRGTDDVVTWTLSGIVGATVWGWLVVRNRRGNTPSAPPAMPATDHVQSPSPNQSSSGRSADPSSASPSIAFALALPRMMRVRGVT